MSKFIHSFIGSLSMNEKAYFKRQAKVYSVSKEKNYLRLFDVIDKMKVYDKDTLKAKFANESLVKHLSSETNYLFDQILKSLVNFNFDNSLKRKLQKAILYIDILMEKGFHKRALKVLYQAKKMAYRSEDFTTILKLIQIEEEVLFTKGILGFPEQLAILSKERQTINEQISNLNQFRLMREQIRELQFSDIPVNEISEHPHFFISTLNKKDLKPLSLKAKQHWFYIFTLGYYIIREYQKAQEVAKEYIEMLQNHEYLFKELTLITAFSNHLYYCALSNDEKSYYSMLDQLNKLEKKPLCDKVFISYIKYARGLELHYRLNNKKASVELISEVETFVETHLSELGTTQSNYLFFLSVRTCLILDQHHAAINWLNLWRDHGILTYTLIYSRIFSLILHLELRWYDLLRSEIDAAYKVLKRHDSYNDLGRAFLIFFKNHLKQPNQLEQSLIKLEEKLFYIYNDPDRYQNLEYFNFLTWSQNKRKRLQNK